jgi:predicted RNase H-like HicB family nuclease
VGPFKIPLLESAVAVYAPGARRATMKLRVVLEPSEDGGYTVTVPSLPGCISEGDSREEALANITEAIHLYLEPVEDDALLARGVEVVEIAV